MTDHQPPKRITAGAMQPAKSGHNVVYQGNFLSHKAIFQPSGPTKWGPGWSITIKDGAGTKIRLGSLTEKTSNAGKKYWLGFWGDARVLGFIDAKEGDLQFFFEQADPRPAISGSTGPTRPTGPSQPSQPAPHVRARDQRKSAYDAAPPWEL